jgi:dTDP-4-dehydrorhamnose reductase
VARNVLISGGKGQLGRALDAVLGTDHSLMVTAVDLPDLDLTKPETVERTFDRVKPEIMFHCAAMTDVDGCERDPQKARAVNDQGTFAAAGACRRANALLVYFSTDFIFDGTLGRPYTETDRPNPLSVYGATKLEGERHAALAGEHIIVRTSWLFGGRRGSFVTKIIDRARAGGILEVVDDQAGSPTFAPDLAEGTAALVHAGGRGIYHVANSGSCSRFGFAKAIVSSAGLAKATVKPVKTLPAPGIARRPASAPLDCTRFAALTGAPLRSWNEALAEYIISADGPLA